MSDLIPQIPNESAAAPIVASTISVDMPCARCGYNLRGLIQGMRCPECGTPVEQSFHGNLLRFADPQWLRRLQLGISLRLWNVLFGILLGIGAVVLQAIFASRVHVLLFSTVALILGLWATFLITSPEPNAGNAEGISLRLVLRVSAVVAAIGGLMNQLAQVGGGIRSTFGQVGLPSGAALVFMILGGVLQLAGILQAFGEFVYYRRFARRIPDRKLEKSTTVVMWGTVISSAIAMVSGIAIGICVFLGLASTATTSSGAARSVPPGFSAGMAISGLFVCVAGVGMLVFGLWYLRILGKYRQAFQLASTGQGPLPT